MHSNGLRCRPFCRWLRKAVPAAGSTRVQARDSLSIVPSPPLLATRADEPAAGCLIDWQATATTAVRRLRPRHLAVLGHSPTTFVWSIIHRRGRTVFHHADPGSACTGSPRENPGRRHPVYAPPSPPCRADLHRGAARAATMLHPSCCVTAITVTCIGTDAALFCLEPLFEKPPWMKIPSRTLQAVRSGCWPTGCGSDTQDAARRWQATSAKPARHLPRPRRLSASPS